VSPRRRLLRWLGWFAVANAALLALIGLRYLWHYAALGRTVSWSYALVTYVGHLSALACIPLFVLVAPVAVLVPRPGLVMALSVTLGSAGVAFVLLDSLLFAENRYHLNVLTFTLLEPQTWAFLALYFLVAVAIEAMVAGWMWRRTARVPTRRFGLYLGLVLGACFVTSHFVHAWAAANYDVSVTAFTRYLPAFYPLRSPVLIARLGLLEKDKRKLRDRGVAALGQPAAGELNYPLAPLRCAVRTPSLNVLLVIVDAMRADALTPEAAPRLFDFARGAIQFDRHYSGGNSSRPGVFSLFYAIPATYFDAFASRTRSPVLMDVMREHGYEFGIFASSPIYRLVELDRTAFAHVPNLRTETSGEGSSERDRALTADWMRWLDRRDASHPFFGFLYYNSAVAVEPPADYRPAIAPPTRASAHLRARNERYLAAVHYVDSLIGQVLADLERREILERTIVIVTSDHGIEFDENRLGFKGHGTAYTQEQMRTPLIVRWPGRPPEHVAHRTSHNDVAPTLLTELFGCENPPSDYASGSSLFSSDEWSWLVVASYREFAVVEPERVTVIFPAGFEVRGLDYRLLPTQVPPRDAVRAAMQEMSRFYK
jgi:membrane-anchored protein YejM (alkaline phosphatase superfamily)